MSKTCFCFYFTSTITGVVPKSLLPLYSHEHIIFTVPAVKEPVFSSSMKWSMQWCQAVVGLDHSFEKLQLDLLQDKHMDWKDILLRISDLHQWFLTRFSLGHSFHVILKVHMMEFSVLILKGVLLIFWIMRCMFCG